MPVQNTSHARNFFLTALLAAGISVFAVFLTGCSSPKPATEQQAPAEGPKRYQLSGRVVSVEPAKQQVVVDAEDIPGFMMAMTMGYAVKSPDQLTPLSPEDQIKADVVVNGTDVHLENIVVVKKADKSKVPASSQPAK
ncbi:MAG TPA: copper-binding protein [Bryobacteraceae bacterium]|nr:copper-binding protein [Bryobacteraceae bacterium]